MMRSTTAFEQGLCPPGRYLLYAKVCVHGGHRSSDELCGFVVAEDEWDAFLENESC